MDNVRSPESSLASSEHGSGATSSAWPPPESWHVALAAAHQLALNYLTSLSEGQVSRHASPGEMAPRFDIPLPETGCSAESAVREWFDRAEPGIVRSPGPRYFGFVVGGATPAALAADWLASALDQNAGSWIMSPAAMQTELAVVRWLLDLFALPGGWSGALTSGATMANLCGLGAARQWASMQLGFDAGRDGLGASPAIPVIASAEVHQSAIKALGVLGLGRDAVKIVPATEGVIDLHAFAQTLETCAGPAIVIANAGEVNTGAFDPIRAMAEICARHQPGAWLHVDGAFGLYAALSPDHRALLDGVEMADSVASDAHKWLNVPYDCGIVFVRDPAFLRGAFGATAAYLALDDTPTVWNALDHVPENSRRFRALSVWCALRAAGRSGYEAIVTRSIANATQFASWVREHPDLELMAPNHLNIVCFRARQSDHDESANDALNAALVEQIQRDGRAYVTATRWQDKTAIRAAFDNWATTTEDIEALKAAVDGALNTATNNQPATASA